MKPFFFSMGDLEEFMGNNEQSISAPVVKVIQSVDNAHPRDRRVVLVSHIAVVQISYLYGITRASGIERLSFSLDIDHTLTLIVSYGQRHIDRININEYKILPREEAFAYML